MNTLPTIEVFPDLVIELDHQGICVSVHGPVDHEANAALRLNRELIVDKHVSEVLLPSVAQMALECSTRVIQRNRVDMFEFSIGAMDSEHYFEARTVRSVRGAAIFIRQVTDRWRSEQRLLESETRFRVMADGAPVLLWMSGLDAGCTFFNAGWLQFTGRTLEQELGEGWTEGVHFEDFQRCMNNYMENFVRHTAFAMEYRLRRADGEYRWLYDQALPRFHANGSFAGYIGSCIDITARKQADRDREELLTETRNLNAQLVGSLKERNVLLQEVHHRVKNNLQVIVSLFNLQMTAAGDSANHGILMESMLRVQAMALIHEQLYQAKDFANVAFADYIRSLAAAVFHVVDMSLRTIELRLEIEDVQIAVDTAVPCGLILSELISNSLKHGFPDERTGYLGVRLARVDSGEVVLTVWDNGVGFPADFDASRATSLGMKLVHMLAAQMRGTVSLGNNAQHNEAVDGSAGAHVTLRFREEG